MLCVFMRIFDVAFIIPFLKDFNFMQAVYFSYNKTYINTDNLFWVCRVPILHADSAPMYRVALSLHTLVGKIYKNYHADFFFLTASRFLRRGI